MKRSICLTLALIAGLFLYSPVVLAQFYPSLSLENYKKKKNLEIACGEGLYLKTSDGWQHGVFKGISASQIIVGSDTIPLTSVNSISLNAPSSGLKEVALIGIPTALATAFFLEVGISN